MDTSFVSYFHLFDEKLLNLQKLVCEKILLVTVHLQKLIFLHDNSEYFVKINTQVSMIFKTAWEGKLMAGAKLTISAKKICIKTFVKKLISPKIFDGDVT